MPFLVYEPDPFIRADICEIVALEFQGQAVAIAESIESIGEMASGLGGPLIAILSVPASVVPTATRALQTGLKEVKTVIIGADNIDLSAIPEGVSFLQRPFSTESLLISIRNAFSDLQRDLM